MPGYISEFQYVGGTSVEFIEVAIPAGTNVSGYSIEIYNSDGTVAHTNTFGSQVTTYAGQDIYVIDNGTAGYSDLTHGQAIALVDDLGDALQFISYSGATVTATEGAADGTTSTSVGSAGFGDSLQSDDGGSSYYTQTSPNEGTIPCFGRGTLIDTPEGPIAVEELRVGDLVETLDNGPRPIRWISQHSEPLDGARPDCRPVLIRAGAIGPALPERDLILSPQHRILAGGQGQLCVGFTDEVLLPAKAATCLPGIRFVRGRRHIEWHHFAFDGHEVVAANGCHAESLLLGPMVLRSMAARRVASLTRIFGKARPESALNGPPARRLVTVGEATEVLSGARRAQSRAA